MIQEYCRNYSIIPQETNKSNNNSFSLNGNDIMTRNKRTLSLNGDTNHQIMNSQNNSILVSSLVQKANAQQNYPHFHHTRDNSQSNQVDYQNLYDIQQQQFMGNLSPPEESKIRTKAQLDNEIEKLRMKLKSVKRNTIEESMITANTKGVNQAKQYQFKENDVPRNVVQNVKVNTKESSGQKSVKGNGSGSLPNAFYTSNNNTTKQNNKKLFSEEVSDRILTDLKKQTAQKVEDFIENCYSTKNQKQQQQQQQQQQSQQQQQQQVSSGNMSRDSKYLKLGDITQQVISSQNQLDNNTSGNQSILFSNSGTQNQANVRQSLNIHTNNNMYGVGGSSSASGIPSKSSVTRHSQGSLPFNNLQGGAFSSNIVTPQNNSSSYFHHQQTCEGKKCTNCIKRREKSAEKVDRRKLSENKKQFLNKYNISDTRKEYSSYKEQKVQHRRYSIHTNQIQEPFNFILQGNQDINISSGNIRHSSWIQSQNQNNSMLYQQQMLQMQDYNQGESYLDSSWNNKVSSHVKALQQAIADNGGNDMSNDNSKLMMLNELNYSQIDNQNNKILNGDGTSNYKSLNTTNIADSSMIIPSNQNNLSNILSQSNSYNLNNNGKAVKNQQIMQQSEQNQKQNVFADNNNSSNISFLNRSNVDGVENNKHIQQSNRQGGVLNNTSNFAGTETQYREENQTNTIDFKVELDGKEYQLQKETFSRVVNHYEQQLKEKDYQNEEMSIKYEQMAEEMHQDNQKLSEYKQQLIIMNNDLAKELEKEQIKNQELLDDQIQVQSKFAVQEQKLNDEIGQYQSSVLSLEKDKSMISKAFEYKSIECDSLKEEILKLKQELQEAHLKIDQQKQSLDEQRYIKQTELESMNTRQVELHKTYKNQFNSFFDKIQQIKVINDDYLLANKREFESIEKRFYEDSLLTKPSCIQSTQGDDLETRNIKLEQENKQLGDRLLLKEQEVLLYKERLSNRQNEEVHKSLHHETSKIKTQYESEIFNLNETVSVMKSNEAKLIEIINELEQAIALKDKEIGTMKSEIESIQNTKFEMEAAASQLKAKIDIVEEQENMLEKKIIELSISHQTSIEGAGGQANQFDSSRGLEIQSLMQKVHKLQTQNKLLNEELIEREKQVNILQHQNQQCQKELEELRCGIQEFESEVQEMKRIYSLSFEQEKKSIIDFYEQKLDEQSKKLSDNNSTNVSRVKTQSQFTTEYNTDLQDLDQPLSKQLLNAYSDPNISNHLKRATMNNNNNNNTLGLPPTNSKKSLSSFTNLNMIKQQSDLALNRRHNETFEETFEDGRGGSYLRLSNITVNPIQTNKLKGLEEPKCTFVEYMNKYTNENGELNTDAFEKEIFQLKEKELLEEIDNLNKRYYLQEQNTQLELSWIRKQTESTTYLDHTQYKEQLDTLQKQIDSLAMIKQQLQAANKEIGQRFEGNVSQEYIEELKQKQLEIQLNEKEITQKLEQYTSINEELQLEYSKNIHNLSDINDNQYDSNPQHNTLSPHVSASQRYYKKLGEISSCKKEKSFNTYLNEQTKEQV